MPNTVDELMKEKEKEKLFLLLNGGWVPMEWKVGG